ncbi:MAG: protein kinase, partial [Myxococcales bacterium]|nr:protein kinase [Myxococcales bacterium]
MELLDQLLELPPAAREARLAEAPRELAAQVRRLLLADATHDPLLDGQGPALVADLLAQELAADPSERAAVDPPTPPDPDRIGPYRVLTRRGEGASGVVYEAEQESPRRRVAIKIVRPRAEGEAARAAFLQEAQALATLSHPVIPYVIEASPWERGVYIAMELVDGLGFREALASKSKAQVLELFARLCDGVHHVHQGGWAHRDLKPANVRMTADGRPKLLDFGLALSLGEHGRPGGTLDYMSPEQAAGARGDHRSDLYSLGVMLHEALTGRVPLSCRGLALVEAAQRKRRRVDLQALEPQLRAVLGRCLQRRPEARYPSAAALAADLRRAAVDLPVVGGPLRASARASLFVRRHRRALTWLLVVAATVACVLVARAGVERWQQQRREAAALKSARSLRASTRALEEQGAEDRAQVVFETWARLPEHQGTRALTRAWLEHQGLFDAVHPLGGREAIAQAYVSAPDDLARVEVLSALAERAYRDGRFATMTRALRALEEFGGVGAPELWARALAGARRLDEAADRLPDDSVGPVLRALARVSPTDVPATSATPALGGRLWLNDWVSKKVRLVEARPQLPVVTEWALPNTLGHMPWGLASEPGLLLQIDDPVTRSARLVRASADRAEVEVLRAALPGPVHHVVEADLDGDGEPGLFWGTGAYARDIFTVDRETGALSRPIAPEDRAGSDVYGLVAGDFDGDGQRELAASFSDWLAYDVRVFEGDERALRVRARVQEHGRLAALPHPDGGDALAVSRQFGEDPGLSLYRLEGDALVRYAFLRRPAALGGDDESLMTGDFDGDGRWDLALMSRRSSRVLTWLIRQVSPGRLDGILVPGTTLIFAQDLDGDGDTELATTTRVDGPITIHGTGAGALEPLTAAVDERSHVADLKLPDVDADLEAITRRPMELARLGLVDLAAELIA